METGLPHAPGSRSGQTKRPEYNPARWTPSQRDAAKARELMALGFPRVTRTTAERIRLASAMCGISQVDNYQVLYSRPGAVFSRRDTRGRAADR
ncbi:hypothetical protein GCM10011428_60340 [Streptomyces violaceus]